MKVLGLSESQWSHLTNTVSKVISANIYGNYKCSDFMDRILFSSQIISQLTVDHFASNYLYKKIVLNSNYDKKKTLPLYLLSSGALAACLATPIVYPIQILRNHRNSSEDKEKTPNFNGCLKTFGKTFPSSTLNITFNHISKCANFISMAITNTSFAVTQYSLIGLSNSLANTFKISG